MRDGMRRADREARLQTRSRRRRALVSRVAGMVPLLRGAVEQLGGLQKGAAVGRSRTVATRVGLAGVVLLATGLSLVGTVVAQVVSSSAYADTTPFELYCTNTPIGDLVLNDSVVTGSLSPAAPAAGQQFSLENFQIQTTVPPDIVQAATAVGNTAISGTVTTTVDATGATPASQSTGAQPYDQSIPSPLPSSGLALSVPSSPLTVGPFTATGSAVALSLGSSISLTFSDVAIPSGFPPLQCSAYPNDAMPSGLATGLPPGLPISPVIATAGGATTPPTTAALTGAYELYCPGTPVGDLVFNGVTTTAAVTPSSLSAGDQFQVTHYQTDIPIPEGPVTAATGLGNDAFDGVAASAVDAYGASPDQVPTGSMAFDLPIPDPVPAAGLTLALPPTPGTVGPFTATGGPLTIAQDDQMLVVAELSSKAFTMTCTAYPDDTIATSGSTGDKPDVGPIRPIIALADVAGSAVTATTAPPVPGGLPGTVAAGQPYELFCPGTPVGDIALNDVTSSATISPLASPLAAGGAFTVSGLQLSLTLPPAVVTELEQLGLTSVSGSFDTYLDVSGTEYDSYPYPVPVFNGTAPSTTTTSTAYPVTTVVPGPTTTVGLTPTTDVVASEGSGTGVAGTSSSGVAVGVPVDPGGPPIDIPGAPGPTASFSAQLPSPVPAAGVQITATEQVGTDLGQYVAEGGPISAGVDAVNLQVQAFGDSFGLFCTPYPDNAEAEGLSVHYPEASPVEPVLATATATMPAPQPGGLGAYELYCPGTPVGNVVLNDVTTSGTITPADPAAGEQFNLTGFQVTLDLPSQIVTAAAALGNSAIQGTATAEIDAAGATPAEVSTGVMNLDVPIPSPVPPGGLSVAVPAAPATLGPFTASGGPITLSQSPKVALTLEVSGSALSLSCVSLPNDSAPTGIVAVSPVGAPTEPVIATTAPVPPVASTTTPVGPSPSTTTPVGPSPSTTTPVGPSPSTTTPAGPSPSTTMPASGPNAFDVAAIDQVYATVFDPTASLADKLADIQNGAAIKGTFDQALSSSLAANLAGARVDSVVFPDAAACTTAGLSSPCARVGYDILDTSGTSLLGGEQGWAVEVDGTWLMATNTICSLLGLFYQAEGKTGAPPGCAQVSVTPTTPTTVTPGQSGAEAAIEAVYNTVFDLSGPIGPKIADIQDGSSIQGAFATALASSIAASSAGATVTSVTFPDAASCGGAGLPSPCARVTYDIDGPSGNAVLADETGWAVEIGGTWLMAKTTVCALLGLFWEASGMQGSPPGCSATSPPITGTSPVAISGTTGTPAPVSASAGDAPTTDAASGSSTTAAAAGTTDPADPTTAASPVVRAASGSTEVTTASVVQADSGALAFTGVGGGTLLLGATGGVLALLGAVLLILADAPRRLLLRMSPAFAGHTPAAWWRRRRTGGTPPAPQVWWQPDPDRGRRRPGLWLGDD